VKQSSAKGREQKLVVHHLDGVTNWDKIIRVIRDELLVHPSRLAPCCKDCHKNQHKDEEVPAQCRAGTLEGEER